MKKVLILFLICVSTQGIYAQNQQNVKLLEFEAGAGFNIGSKFNDSKAEIGMQLLMELRFNIKESPLAVGLQFGLSHFSRKGDNGYNYDHEIRSKTMITYADYNYRKWNKVSLFGGLGLGAAFIDNEYKSKTIGSRDGSTVIDRSFVVSPRVGAEFYNRIRLSLDYKFMSKEYSYTGLNIGFVFGGGNIK